MDGGNPILNTITVLEGGLISDKFLDFHWISCSDISPKLNSMLDCG